MIDNGPELTKFFEGYSKEVYLDSKGYPTHGYGFLLELRSYKTVKEYHDAKFEKEYTETEKEYETLGLDLDPVRRACVIDLLYNMTLDKVLKFHDTLAALRMRDWQCAARCLECSKWFKDVGRRGPMICNLIRTGRWDAI
jgi:GH24 family phage-related lysozyme (muramidase)